jgi:hypothetical protein
MTYSTAACAAIGMDCAENTIPLLFTGSCLVTAGCCDSAILALSEYVTICTLYFTLALLQNTVIFLFKCLFHRIYLSLSPAQLLGVYVTTACATPTNTKKTTHTITHSFLFSDIVNFNSAMCFYDFIFLKSLWG